MKHHASLVEFQELLADVSRQVQTSVAMGHLDVAHISENLFCELFRALLGWDDLRNLNTKEKKNFPSIDLADNPKRLAVQVTATANMKKVRNTIEGFLRNGFDKDYDRLILYVLTERQRQYNQTVVDILTNGRLQFSVERDILDYRALARAASTAPPKRLRKSLQVLRAYVRGVADGLAEEDFDPPPKPPETLIPNLLEVFFPPVLHLAHLIPEAASVKNRKGVRYGLAVHGLKAPSDYEVSSGQIITFRDLGAFDGPFASIVDPGTVTSIPPADFFNVDHDHENTFKSLLRFLLQQRLYHRAVVWNHTHNLFVFHPLDPTDNVRRIRWNPNGGKVSKVRKVFERKMQRKDPTKVSWVKHLAFLPQFVRAANRWYLSISPDWFFSYGSEFSRSVFADEHLTAIKRMERESSVRNHFRFWASWLAKCDEEDMFSSSDEPVLTYAAPIGLTGGPCLDEDDWEVPREVKSDDFDPGTHLQLEGL